MSRINNRAEAIKYILTCDDSSRPLQCVTNRLRKNREVVLAAVSRHGSNLLDVGPPLCSNMEVILTALRNSRHAIRGIPRGLSSENRAIILQTIIDLNEYECIPHGDMQCNVETSSFWVASCYTNCREMVLRVVAHCGSAIQNTKFKDDDEIALTAVTHDIRAYKFISDRLRKNDIILSTVLNSDTTWALPCIIEYIPLNLLQKVWVIENLIQSVDDRMYMCDDYLVPIFDHKKEFLRLIAAKYHILPIPHIIRVEICTIIIVMMYSQYTT